MSTPSGNNHRREADGASASAVVANVSKSAKKKRRGAAKTDERLEAFHSLHANMQANLATVRSNLQRSYSRANRLDLVLVMDCTNSMALWIDVAKREMATILATIQVDHPQATVRVGFVAYRDFCDGSLRLEIQQLTTELARVEAFIASLEATGGGDGPEDIPGGLDAALRLDWQADAKCLVLVADAPCHGELYNDLGDDHRYAAEILESPCIQGQMRELATRGIDFAFIDIVPKWTATMLAMLEQAYESVLPAHGNPGLFSVVPLDNMGDEIKFAPVVSHHSSAVLLASQCVSVFSPALAPSTPMPSAPLPLPLAPPRPPTPEWSPPMTILPLDWNGIGMLDAVSAERHTLCLGPGSMDWSAPDLRHATHATTLRLCKVPFARGGMRTAHGLVDATVASPLVAKFYFGRAKATGYDVRRDVETQTIAKALASAFTMATSPGADFLYACWYTVDGLPAFTAEPFMDGDYRKFNNNSGWTQKAATTAQAFSHFTWQHTLGQALVVDLQGVDGLWTDPQIHALDKTLFGRGNLGEEGMTRFFATHECNALCTALGLPPFDGPDPMAAPLPLAPSEDEMRCSCWLCGATYTRTHAAVVAELKANDGCDVHCDACTALITATTSTVACSTCNRPVTFAAYRCEMEGEAPPTLCMGCTPPTLPTTNGGAGGRVGDAGGRRAPLGHGAPWFPLH
ncbi:hypothetical protein SDRG_06810 [Saprolegnia diclina VS20]|uniref:Alpha-type protein kinase domain-containing protein n=1 Tax=Saprolegnia diclina (strain VS20) TaxID=1156394 RepID=T0QCC2_SAPDV|nr:hypothetical protein SDRG_06810 [Saprolegnia diclina VS20]EQC35519.1 hypothetical protein SDRG_06810 [Saprolegnia diclina VS20]|eukprot:XP_008610836.1 hypothetical protein SDRG_06810 [Saprolegnia diclina VS20]